MQRTLSILFLFASLSWGYSQSVVADFMVKANACLNESLSVSNQSTGAASYEWDFCLNDIKNLKQSTSLVNVAGLSWCSSYKLVQDNGSWYGFAASFNNNKLYKLNYGSSPSNVPSITDMGNLGGQLSLPFGVELVFSNNEWFGFVASYDISAGLLMLSFGNSLANTPTISNLGTFGITTRFMDVKAITQTADNLLVLIAGDPRSIVVVNFKSSFHNAVLPANVFNSGSLTGINSPYGLDVVKVNGNWISLVSNYSTSEIFKLNFGTDIQNVPTVETSFTFQNVTTPLKLKILQEGSGYFAAVSVQSQSLVTIDFKDLSNSSTPQIISQPTLPVVFGLDAARWQGKTIIQGISDSNSTLQHLLFENVCSSSLEFSTAQNPPVFSYSNSGPEEIELVAFSSTGEKSVTGKFLTVSSSTSPDIDFNSQNSCANNTVTFTSANQSGNISTYAWDFGDGGNSSGSTTNYIYSSASIYDVTLTATASNGCQNSKQKSIQIFNPPQANFTLPSANPFCTNQNYVFTNTSTYDNGSNPTWQWNVNGSNVSTTQDLNYQLSSPISQSIKLTASIPGCSSQSTQSISTVQTGPSLSFTSVNTGCVSSAIDFTNTSTGSVLGYSWAFGDGNTSNQTNASNSFSSTGVFNVTLSGSNAAGCQNSYSKSIPVYSNPSPDFSIDLPPFSCAGSASQFNDLTPPLSDSNLSGWSWQFGDAANGTSSARNPAYTYSSAADYLVSLQVTSNFGCSASIQKTITIQPSPQAAFTNSAACINQVTQFTDASTGGVKSRQWKIQGNTITATNPTFTFKSSTTFPVTLAVTGNNNCINQVTQNVVVPEAPIMDFSILYPCTQTASQFQETNPDGSDPAVSWNWNFTSASGTGNPANYSFATAGLYTVTLTSTRQSQCAYSVSKNLTIIDGPVAAFTSSATAGGAPLNVVFTNNSTLADTYSWSFGDASNTTSTDPSTTFLFTQLGAYTVTLTASNTLNCTNTASTVIDVVVPSIDAALASFMLADDPSTSSKRPLVTIENESNIPIVNPVVTVDLGGNVSLKETVVGTIPAGSSLSRTLAMQIVPYQISYVCAKVDVAGDVFEDNNKQCVTLTQDEVVLTPYPNPASSEFGIEWINTFAQDVHVIVFKTNGQVAFDQIVTAPAGLTQYKINCASWANGLYLVQISDSKSQKLYKVAVVN